MELKIILPIAYTLMSIIGIVIPLMCFKSDQEKDTQTVDSKNDIEI